VIYVPLFKDYLQQDLNIFFNPDEFGEVHKINGRDLTVIVDNERLMERTKKEFDGISIGELLYFVKASDYGERPTIGEAQKFDKRQMYVVDVRDSDGVYEIILSRNYGG